MKICSKCNAEKHLKEFSNQSSSKDGKRPSCKKCDSASYAEYSLANKEKILARSKKYRDENPEKCAASAMAYRKKNPGKRLESSRSYQRNNPEKIAADLRAYRSANPEKTASFSRNRRAKIKHSEGNHCASDILAIFNSQKGLCANCSIALLKSGKRKYHVDHIMPLALGGSNWPANLQCLCPPCNLSKSAKHPDEWAKQQGKLL